MKEPKILQLVAKSLREPSFKTIEGSQLDCGYTLNGFDPKLIDINKYNQGTHSYIRALFNSTNLNAPTEAPNVYLAVPAEPTFLDKPSMSDTIEFKQSLQILEGEDLSPDQAIGLQARAKLKSDPRLDHLNANELAYLEGSAAALAVASLRDFSIFEKLPLTKAISPEYSAILDDNVKFVSNIGPASDLVLKPIQFFVLEKGERAAKFLLVLQ